MGKKIIPRIKRLLNKKKLVRDLEVAKLLQGISTKLIQADGIDLLYDQILETAMMLLRSEYACFQLFKPERGTGGELYLLRYRGFKESDVRVWEWVTPCSRSSCGMALNTRQRVVFPDILKSDYMVGGPYLESYSKIGIRAVQTTPLLTRDGTLIGMFSTYWCRPHELTETESFGLDVLARQAADLIERAQNEQALRQSKERYRCLAQKLQEASRRKDEFLGLLSHEIRNPLASITLCLTLLEKSAPACAQNRKALEIMKRQVSQLTRLVDDLLDISRITQGKIKIRKELVALGDLVQQTVADFQTTFRQKGIKLAFCRTAEPIFVEADPIRLSQVVGNLLHNAAKFTGTGGFTRVTVTKNTLKKRAVIRVEDNGRGISGTMKKNIFEPFVQGDTDFSRSKGGLGLGLALVKGLVEKHRGAVFVGSEGPGRGSQFTVHLPLAAGRAVVENCAEEAPVYCCNRRVLVIEDNTDVAESLRSLLENDGHEVFLAADGREGLALARKINPEILICDIGLPGLNGYQVAREFLADEALREVFLISLTGYARPADRRRAVEAGFQSQLTKPVALDTLRRALARADHTRPT